MTLQKNVFRVAVLFFLLTPMLSADEMRTWTDSTGEFKIEATLHRIRGDRITLKKADGKFVSFDLDKLSEGDRKFVTQRQKEADNPFAGGSDKDDEEDKDSNDRNENARESDSRSARQRAEALRGEGRSRRMGGFRHSRLGGRDEVLDIDGQPGGNLFDKAGKPIKLATGFEAGGDADIRWSCKADPAPVPEFKTPPRHQFFRFGSLPFAVSVRDAGFVPYVVDELPRTLYAANISSHGDESGKTLIVLGDLSTGKSESLLFDQKLTLFDVSPNGRKALIGRAEWGFGSSWGTRKDLHIAGIEDAKFTSLAVYEPFAETSRPNEMHNLDGDVHWAAWVDDDHVMVQSGRRHIIVIHAESGKVLWKMSLNFVSPATFSPGRRFCLISDSAGTMLLESLTGKAVGRLDGAGGRIGRFDFSPDGKWIASYGPDGVMIWDATTGEIMEGAPFYIGAVKNPSVTWVAGQFVLIGSRLIDIRTQFPAWDYRFSSGESMRLFGGYCWYLSGHGRDGRRLVSVKLPHGRALEASKKTDSDWLPVAPGVSVSLVLDESVKKDRSLIEEKMKEKLVKNDMALRSKADLALVLKVTREDEATVNYGIGRNYSPSYGKDATEIKYRPHRFSIEYQLNGTTIWALSKTTSAPYHIDIEEVQKSSLQSVVDKAMKKANAEYKEWFSSVILPPRIVRFDEKKQSTLTESGIRDR